MKRELDFLKSLIPTRGCNWVEDYEHVKIDIKKRIEEIERPKRLGDSSVEELSEYSFVLNRNDLQSELPFFYNRTREHYKKTDEKISKAMINDHQYYDYYYSQLYIYFDRFENFDQLLVCTRLLKIIKNDVRTDVIEMFVWTMNGFMNQSVLDSTGQLYLPFCRNAV